MRLRNKVALVTGGGSGIGRATCELFAREGAVLAVLDLDPSTAETTANSVRGKVEVIALNADVSDSTDLRKAIDAVIARFGRIDVLVNNAGYGIPRSARGKRSPRHPPQSAEVEGRTERRRPAGHRG